MRKLMTRIRELAGSLGNEGACANVAAEIARVAQARLAVDELERRMALAHATARASHAAVQAASHAA
jgi:H+/Cl- antiporter ClcA